MPHRPLYQRVLLTGANGLVGQALVERLSGIPEVDLLATSRDPGPRFATGSCGYTPLDVTDADAVRRLFLDFAPSAVINCAALTRVEQCDREKERCWTTNVDAVAALARACKAQGARLVQLSTDFVFDGTDGPYGERDHPHPINYYGRSKLASENAVRTAGLRRWTVIRTALGFGTGERLSRGNFGLFLVERLRAGEPTLICTDQVRSPTYVPDLADGIARAVLRDRTGIYHLSGREILSTFDFARRLAERFDFDPELFQPTTTAALHPNAPRPLKTGLLILKAETELGYKPRTLEQALDHFGRRLGLPVAAP
ncbi:MAG: NAD(P)-dependent oxidoreductase [Rhodothermales bacterium]|nr:NAD(P)-dependent oxidoreductase [Rhodothermales bacterium]